ncbi:hypothetical protein L873DRAFT_1821023 [Choiromyces venosus 120613-1]|uniref:Uncharacterized protein n=1 Tax=Choiromyces venosus 120613-1 TaxID=1336337 RepID=A0A3N4J9F2_9PEZI|nr:hypothetical protein L873DRAFT_1821023 [Choiromyces venosus 120613-1]
MLEKRQMESTPGDQVTEVLTVVDTVVSPGTTKAPVTVTRPSTSLIVPTKTPTLTSASPTSSTPTSTSPTSSSALYCDAGFSLCGAEFGGGCCRTGYTCAITGCIPPAGATTTPPSSRTCTITSYTLCPPSMNYGCCGIGQECGLSSCTPAGGAAAVTKMPDVNGNNLKVSATATAPTPSSSTPTGDAGNGGNAPLSKIAIGGIVGGAVAAIIALALAWIFTRNHIKRRSNTGASGGVPTTNVFDPTATLSGQHGSHNSHYRGSIPSHPPLHPAAKAPVAGGVAKMSEHRNHPAGPLSSVPPAHSPPVQHSPPPGDQGFDFGIPGVGASHAYQPVPLSEQVPVELGASPVERWGVGELQGVGNEVYEVEGDARRSPGGNGKRKSWGWGRGGNAMTAG